jgi:phosphoenolpyruvate carboxykinase (ATP)
METFLKREEFLSMDILAQLVSSHKQRVFQNLHPASLVEKALERQEGCLAANGALVTMTGERTGRSPYDRYIVKDSWSNEHVSWGKINASLEQSVFDELLHRVADYLSSRDRFVFDGFVGNHHHYRMPLRVIAEKAWHALFSTTLFVRPTTDELQHFTPEFTVIDAQDFQFDPSEFNLRSGTCVALSFEKKMILIIGSGYGGEIKKSIFTIMNGLLPEKNVFPMHCSANVGREGDVALFFGLSGTGKTTLSADEGRRLIGDDEHGWSDEGVFNFEGGCYAKVIRLSEEAEPQIHRAIRFGSLLENVVIDEYTRLPNYDDASITENTRATYPVEHIPHCIIPGIGGQPKHIFFLTCDAFGVLPPITKLNPEAAMYHFLSGYTATP